MTPDDIERLALAAQRAGMEHLELTQDGCVLRIRVAAVRPSAAVDPVAAGPMRATTGGVRASGVGRFRHRHPLTGQPVTTPGQHVQAGQIVGLLEIGPCLRPVPAPHEGVIGPAIATDGAVVGYGTILFALD